MAEGYSRQTAFLDGDIILAEHGNLEFDKLVNVFNDTTGHTHDGTPGGGASVPLLMDPTGVQDLTLTPTGLSGSVVLDEDDMVSDSAEHLVTQQSIKAYVDVTDTSLQVQIDAFGTSNHTHSWLPRSVDFVADVNKEYQVVAESPVDVTLGTIAIGNGYVVHNSIDSTAVVQILNPTTTIKGPLGEIPPGTDLILEPGDTASLLVQTLVIMEVA